MYIIVILIVLIPALIALPILISKAQKKGPSRLRKWADDGLARLEQQKEIPKYHVNTTNLLVDEHSQNVLYMNDGGPKLFDLDGANRAVEGLNYNRHGDMVRNPYEYRPTFPAGLQNVCSLEEFINGQVEIYSLSNKNRVTEITRAISLYDGMFSVKWSAKTVSYRTEN